MTSATILRHELARAGRVTVALHNIASLAAAAQGLDVTWTFAPGTPPQIVDYLAGAGVGAAQGLAAGTAAGLLLAFLFPPAIIGYAAAGGAIVGAVRGANRVKQGWRVQLFTAPGVAPWLDVSVA
jgi:hypothetical protein